MTQVGFTITMVGRPCFISFWFIKNRMNCIKKHIKDKTL